MLKKIAIAVLMAVGAVSAFAQGQVNFNNNQTDYATPADRFIHFGTGVPGQVPGTLATGTSFKVQLWVGSDASSLQPLLVNPANLRTSTTITPGTWTGGGTRDLVTSAGTFAKGSTVFLQVKAWDISTGATFDQSRYSGASGVFSYTSPTSDTAAPAAFYMEGLRAFDIVGVPEPSTFALAGLGILGLAFWRRRK